MSVELDKTTGTFEASSATVETLNGNPLAENEEVQRMALALLDGPDAVDVGASAPLPVEIIGTPSLPAGGATEAALEDINASILALGLLVDGLEAIDYATDAKLELVRLLLVDIKAKLNASVAVTGTFWQATQPVSGPLTDAQLRAAAVPVSLAASPADLLTALQDIEDKITASTATEATLLDVLADLDAIFGAVDGLEAKDFATQTTLALAKTALDDILTKLNAEVAVTAAPASGVSRADIDASAVSVTLLASNANRRGAMIFNDSNSALYVKFGAAATSTSYTIKMAGGSYYEVPAPVYTGIIDGIWDNADGGAARVTELT